MEKHKRRDRRRITSRDVPELLRSLSCDNAAGKAETLTKLCPCRCVRYDREIWLAIFDAANRSTSYTVRDQAKHAIETLKERAARDPRSQELVAWLLEQGVAPDDMADALPRWQPPWLAEVNGLKIPRFEAPSRSRKNRSRR